ncbi:hypothetical protein SK128_027486, partial [Halocaridina rubra]
ILSLHLSLLGNCLSVCLQIFTRSLEVKLSSQNSPFGPDSEHHLNQDKEKEVMTDNRIYRTRTLGIPAEGLKDQYADGTAAKLWELYIGDKNQRTQIYRDFIVSLLREKKCKNILDAACGTGVDSIMLLEDGFKMTSVDLSDKMLKYALKTRWNRRKEAAFDDWVIEEANWLTLPEDIKGSGSFDAVVCLGNSFAHLPDITGDQSEHRLALRNFAEMVKPGGILVIDHRNYDYIIERGCAPSHNIYYNLLKKIVNIQYTENKGGTHHGIKPQKQAMKNPKNLNTT